MGRIGIITIVDNNNYGNRLQNYAVQNKLMKICNNSEIITLDNEGILNLKTKPINYICRLVKAKMMRWKRKKIVDCRYKCFEKFNNNINFSESVFNFYNKESYDYLMAGSDQIWNPMHNRLREFDLIEFKTKAVKMSFSASFGINELPEQYKKKTTKALEDFKAISVREEAGKKIVEDLTGRKDIQVLVDPTMLLTAEEWDKVSKKPKQLKNDKYILNYFLGELSEIRKKEIDRIAIENNCEIINILDKNSPFYQTGPSEFLYLEKNAFLICTDSFHSSVFAILYNRPFIVFDREDSLVSMNSRIETLINKFNLKNRKFTGRITEENLKHDYTEAYEILEKERKKSDDFLRKALDIDEQEGAR